MLKVIELFGGIGACTQALKRLGIDFEIADYVEIDKYAVASYNAINGTNFEPQDITKYDKDIQADLIMHGSPCQDFSVCGKNAGGDFGSGTRSSLMYETLRIVNKIKPKYVIWENVKNLLSKKHFHNFQNYLDEMTNIGYNSYYKVLNAKDYGIPQNRERVFTISIRKDIDKTFKFPEPEELKLKLKDFLEDNVDEKYYLNDKIKEKILYNYVGNIDEIGIDLNDRKSQSREIASTIKARYDCGYEHFAPGPTGILIKNNTPKVIGGVGKKDSNNNTQYKQQNRVYNNIAISVTTCCNPYYLVRNNNKKGYDIAIDGDSINLQQPNSTTRRGRVGHQVSNTLQCTDTMGVVEKTEPDNYVEKKYKEFIEEKGYIPQMFNPYNKKEIKDTAPTQSTCCGSTTSSATVLVNNDLRIRKLTPKECWRLMGFSDEEFEKAEKVNSNTQLYKQAGNSIVVDVLCKILRGLNL